MKKINLFLITLFCLISPVFATALEDVKMPKDYAYRIGTNENIEKKAIIKLKSDSTKIMATKQINENEFLTFSDLSLQMISKDIISQVNLNQTQMLSDIQLLWQGAALKSETIKFAIFKLSNPDADKPDEKIVKKVFKQVANFSTLAGMGFTNPVAASATILSGSFLGNFAMDDKQINYKYSKINDADMVVLVKKIDNLQLNLINKYLDYISSRQLLVMNNILLEKRQINYDKLKNINDDQTRIADSYMRMALDRRDKSRLEYLSKRAALEQLVGIETFSQFEKEFLER